MKKTLQTSLVASMLALAIITTAIPAPKAEAATSLDELRAQIAILLERIAELQATANTSDAPAITLSRNLSQGMTGSDVKALQQFLNSDVATAVAVSGVGSKGNETEYFGSLTTQAVINFQNKYKSEVLTPVGLNLGTGYVGPSTRAHIKKLGETTATGSNDTDTNGGNADTGSTDNGTVQDDPIVAEEGDITATRGSEHTSILELSGGFEEIYSVQIKAEDAPMTVNRIDFRFDKRPWKYIDTFELYHEDEKIATLKASESNISSVGNEYRVRFTGLSELIKKNDKDTFVLKAKALKSLSSDRENDSLTVYVPERGIRAKDTAGITSYSPSADLAARDFDFRDAENDGEVVVSLATDSPESNIIAIKQSQNTTNSTVMIASIKADESDLDVQEVYFKVTSSEATVANVVRNLSLVFNGKTIEKRSVVKNNGAAITGIDEEGNSYVIIESGEYYVRFDDLDGIEIKEDDREKLTVNAEFYKQDGRYANGTDVTFILRSIMGENQFGEDVINGDLTTGSNRNFSLYTDGLLFTYNAESAKTQGVMDRTGVFTISFDVTAFGSDIYVKKSAARVTGTSTIGSVATEYSVENSADERYALGSAVQSLQIKGAKTVGSYYRIAEGSSHTVTLQVSLDNTGATADFYRAALEAFRFNVGSESGTEHTITNVFKKFETDVVSINS